MKNIITIVIPCKNEEAYIYETLRFISFQYEIQGVKIIIADANSTDNTIQEINRAKQDFKLNIEIIEGGPVAKARNNGAKLVKTPYIAFIDADTILLNSNILISSVLNVDADYKLVTCGIKSLSKDIKSKIMFKVFNFVQRYLLRHPFSTGAYFFTSTQEFKRLGGFDEKITQAEDYVLSRKYKNSEFKILSYYVGQDDRRFKQMGYIGFLKLVIQNYKNRKNPTHFSQPTNYWK